MEDVIDSECIVVIMIILLTQIHVHECSSYRRLIVVAEFKH